MADSRKHLGTLGERMAAEWYRRSGYQVVTQNWRCPDGELDLVCRLDSTVVICEVKTRASRAFGAPVEAVTLGKQRRLRQLAARWLREHSVRCDEVRFDVAAIANGKVQIIKNAF